MKKTIIEDEDIDIEIAMEEECIENKKARRLMMDIFIRKNIFIKVVLFDGTNIDEIKKLVGSSHDVQPLSAIDKAIWIDSEIVGVGMYVAIDNDDNIFIYSKQELLKKYAPVNIMKPKIHVEERDSGDEIFIYVPISVEEVKRFSIDYYMMRDWAELISKYIKKQILETFWR